MKLIAIPERLYIHDGLAGYDATTKNNGSGTVYFRGDIVEDLVEQLRQCTPFLKTHGWNTGSIKNLLARIGETK